MVNRSRPLDSSIPKAIPIAVIDARTRVRRATFDAGGTVLCVAVSDDGRELAAGTVEGTVRIWKNGRAITTDPRLGPVQSLRFSGTDLVGTAAAGSIRIPQP